MLKLPPKSRVLVVSGNERGLEYIRNSLNCAQFELCAACSSASEARRLAVDINYDIIIINAPLSDENGVSFASDMAQRTVSGIILLVKSDSYEDIRGITEQNGVFTLEKPFRASSFDQALHFAVASNERFKFLITENSKLKTKLDEVRIVNRAKWVLISYLGMTEEQAHKYIEKQAMDLRIPKNIAAENIIKTYEN